MLIPPYNPQNLSDFTELPQRTKVIFEETIKENFRYAQLLKEAERARKTGNYVLVLKTYHKLDEIRLLAQKHLLEQQEETVSLLDLGLPKDKLDEINIMSLAMYIACDMIESLALDINKELKKFDNSLRFEMFNPIIAVGKEAKENLRYLWKSTSVFETDDFGDQSDKMMEMLLNKAKKVYTKYNENKLKSK